mgnify:CR=1 FL=1
MNKHFGSLVVYKCPFSLSFSSLFLTFLFVGVDGGFDNNDPEYEESYEIVILPDYVSLPFPSVELPEKVIFFSICMLSW